jgi:hypothetical protein
MEIPQYFTVDLKVTWKIDHQHQMIPLVNVFMMILRILLTPIILMLVAAVLQINMVKTNHSCTH